MNHPLVLVGLFVFCSSIVGKINGEPNDEIKTHARDHAHHDPHQKSHHHVHQKSHEHQQHHKSQEKHHFYHALGAHQARHHKGLKTRQGNESCTNICVDEQLAAVAKWLNGTKELQFLYKIIPTCSPCGKSENPLPVFPNISIPFPFDPNVTFSGNATNSTNITLPFPGTNVTFSVPTFPGFNLTGLYNASAEYPIITYFAKLFGRFIAGVEGVQKLFQRWPEFMGIWKAFIGGLNFGACNRTQIFLKNLNDLFGCNGTFGSHFFNLTYWEQLFLPSWNSSFVSTIEHDIEGIASAIPFVGR